jgi:lipopolysaccharide biosynthesis glycosyltransferase
MSRLANMNAVIAIIGDEAYAAAVAALIRSIGTTWQGADRPRVRIVGPTWSVSKRFSVQDVAAKAGCRAEFASVNPDMRLPLRSRWNRTIYSRLSLGRTCGDVERVLCLDSDMIAITSLHELLLEQDLEGAPVGATHDLCVEAREGDRTDPKDAYFNSGLLLVDVQRWEDMRIGEKAEQVLLTRGTALEYLDQDALNIVVKDSWTVLDQRWNVFHFNELISNDEVPADLLTHRQRAELQRLQKEARCLHYVGPQKPWIDGYPDGLNLQRFAAHAGRACP